MTKNNEMYPPDLTLKVKTCVQVEPKYYLNTILDLIKTN